MGRPKKWVRPFSQASTTMDWPPRLWPFSPEMAWSQNWMVELVEVQKMMGKNMQKHTKTAGPKDDFARPHHEVSAAS